MMWRAVPERAPQLIEPSPARIAVRPQLFEPRQFDLGELPDPTPAIPGAINVTNLRGNEIVLIGVGPMATQTTTAAIAALSGGGGGGAIPVDLDTAGGPQTYTLTASPTNGVTYQVKDATGHATANPITITAGGVIMIDSAPTASINQNNGSLDFRWNATLGKWLIG
jgi:hypothetical protein